MNSYVKALTPMLMAVLVGSLTFIFAQSERGDVGKSPISAERNLGVPALTGGKFVRGFSPAVAEHLDLTDAQKTQIEQLQEKSRAESKIYFEKMKSAAERLKEISDGGSFDESQARKIIGEKTQAFAELEIIRLRNRLAINNLLSAEQKEKLGELNFNHPEPPSGGGKLGMPPLPPPPPEFGNSF